VLKLPAESSTRVELPPSGFQPRVVAANTTDGVYVTTPADNRVLKLPAVFQPWAVAADTAGQRSGHMTWRRRLCDAVVVGRSEVLAAADSLADLSCVGGQRRGGLWWYWCWRGNARDTEPPVEHPCGVQSQEFVQVGRGIGRRPLSQ
jgi:hypothetical protein